MLLGKRRRKETEAQAAVRALVDLDAPAGDAETACSGAPWQRPSVGVISMSLKKAQADCTF